MIDETRQALAGFFGAIGIASLARMLAHHKLVKLGKRRLWSWDLAWEIPTALFMGLVGGGVATFLKLDGASANALIGVVAYLGPKGLEALIFTAAQKWAGDKGSKS